MIRDKRRNIVILGAGFGGVAVYQNLKHRIDPRVWRVVLINRTDHFLFSPLLHEVAAGNLAPDDVVEDIRTIIHFDRADFVEADATSVDLHRHIVHTHAGPIRYERLVIATGATTNFRGAVGAKEHAITLKSLVDAELIRERCTQLQEHQKHPTVVIVGGGATGVELAAELADREMAVTLIHSGDALLNYFHPKLRRIARTVLEGKGIAIRMAEQVRTVHSDGIVLADGSRLPAALVVWTAGVHPLVPLAHPAWPLNPVGRLDVDHSLQLRGFHEVWALGDCAGAWPMHAQVAVQQGALVAQNIVASLHHRSQRQFWWRERGHLVSLGKWHAVGDVFGIRWSGPLAWVLWRVVYLMNFASLGKRFRVLRDWTLDWIGVR